MNQKPVEDLRFSSISDTKTMPDASEATTAHRPLDDLNSISTVDLIRKLPLRLIKSETIPPAPNRGGSSIDWLPDFAGYAWIAYGASSCLVISHFPSPLSPHETSIGPIFRQVLDFSAAVTAVAWSPTCPSDGDVAAASENCICLFSNDSTSLHGSFCWSQTASLVQSTKVEVVTWTGSRDGIIAGGIEVVLWKNKDRLWEIAWKFRAELPQTLVSSTWSIEGPSATAAHVSKLHVQQPLSKISEAIKCVLVCHSDGNARYLEAVLRHPQPVSLIQWRPSTGRSLNKDARHSARQMLLTCCLDGVVRLWSEFDDGKVRKIGKDVNEKTGRRSFCVAAVIEINQIMNGTLGSDIFVTWVTDLQGIINTEVGANRNFSTEGYQLDKSGKCEWLIGLGPGMLLTFWAVHCIDDIYPLRFPRVTLWQRRELQGYEAKSHRTINSNSIEQSLLNKVVIFRNQLFGPPTLCSSIQVLSSNSLNWSLLYSQTSSNTEGDWLTKSMPENFLSCCVDGTLGLEGHGGYILQVEVHPCSCEVRLAASLDSYGIILFWSVSSTCSQILGPTTLNPVWKYCGQLALHDACPKYTSLRWAPSVLRENPVLLMGHAGGIDCIVVKVPQSKEEAIACHNLCTIPYKSEGPHKNDPPADIFAIPLPSPCSKTCTSIKFMLLGIWIKEFQALSWKVNFHSFDLSENCDICSFDSVTANCGLLRYENFFSGDRYGITVESSSLQFPYLHRDDLVTSYAVLCHANLIPDAQKDHFFANGLSSDSPAYHIATGCSDGRLKLWRSNPNKTSAPDLCWELVGVLAAHHGPISAMSMSNYGQKIATICTSGHPNAVSSLCIWDSLHISGSGSFILEDSLSLDGVVIALNWLALGNGQFLLGVCMENELRIYAPRRHGGQTLLNSEKSLEMHIWYTIAVAYTTIPMRSFLWGPLATAVVVHDNYFSLFGQWLLFMYGKNQVNWHANCAKDRPHDCNNGTAFPIFFDGDMEPEELVLVDSACGRRSGPDGKVKMNKIHLSCGNYAAGALVKHDLGTKLGFWSMIEVGEKLSGSLPVYHPEALLMNICSGNWKRAYIAVQHLVEFLTSNDVSGKSCGTGKCGQIVPQINLLSYLEELLPKSSKGGGCQWSANTASVTSFQFQSGSNKFGYNSKFDASSHMSTLSLSKSETSGFVEPLEKLYRLAAITNIEKMQILAIIDLLSEVGNPHSDSAYKTLDEPGRRFWVAVRFQQLYFHRRFGRLASIEDIIVHSELIGWGFHSDCQEILFGSILPNEPYWQEMRTLGVGFWLTDAAQLRTRMEKLARSQYLRNKDPKACALLYVALNRLQVLAGLFKISKDVKDKPMVGFLSRNFQEEKHKAAALKNAYVLMGRHQLELAIAFFLLGDDTSSAVTVCAKNLGDEQLALVICRLVEGYGGPLERHLISKFMLPSAIQKGDYWLASHLEWVLGNHSQSFLSMLAFQMGSEMNQSAFASNHAAFLDPSIGQYCLKLATTNNMRNAVGEQNAAILCRWSKLMTATALYRRGLPLEALECFSSSPAILESTDLRCKLNIGNSEILARILEPNPSASSNWLSGDVALNLETKAKLHLAMQYLSRLIKEHPSWEDNNVACSGVSTSSKEPKIDQYEVALENFQYKLCRGLAIFEQKFYLIPASLVNLILGLLCNNGLFIIGYDILRRYISHDQSQYISDRSSVLYPILLKLLLEAAEEISCLLSRLIFVCSMSCSRPQANSIITGSCCEIRLTWYSARDFYMQCPILLLWRLRGILLIFSGSCTEYFLMKSFMALDLFEYLVVFALAWLQKNLRCLVLMVDPPPIKCSDEHTPCGVDIANLNKLLQFAHNMLTADVGGVKDPTWIRGKQGGDIMSSIPEDERWQIVGACLWQHMSCFLKRQLNLVFDNLGEGYSSSSACPATYGNSMNDQIKLVSVILAKTLETALIHLSSHQVQQFASFLRQKVEDNLHVPTLTWLEDNRQSRSRTLYNHLKQAGFNLDMTNSNTDFSVPEISWEFFADPKIILDGFAQENINWSKFIKQKPFKNWSELYEGLMEEFGSEESNDQEGRFGGGSAGNGTASHSRGLFGNGFTFLTSGKKDAALKSYVFSFQNPKETYKRNGELLEALCINSIDQRQAALAGNQKGITFLNWEDSLPFRNHSDFIWSEADWPQNGWAGSESTPVPTCVSPGIGLGSKGGAHLGLGGATIGLGSLARPGRDFTGGGTFGLPGYAGGGPSGLGWEIQEDFEEFIDPPATVENISTRAMSSHPSRPFFLVGSSNTHIYLWEFGKATATATYGVLPAANVPPPYALAAISSLQFDHFGHRFATAASDGTICTWQLEVGGRSNVHPTESSLCFNSHASDIGYVTSSGSIIAVAGCSSNGVNVVIWDTLAPHTTSRASILCHEGGCRSLAVFDNDIGSGSISPIIVTGGKGGDVGLHDFRYIATGKTKRHRRPDTGEQNNHVTADMPTGILNKSSDLNSNGMLWYIPKAHLGSVTKISTIPNTSLFLTGSKDGDVKLWDAKRAKLVFHWSKLHERHTFLQPSSRGYGGVVRAAVTDIQVVSHGFLTCGGDGSVKLVQLKDQLQGT